MKEMRSEKVREILKDVSSQSKFIHIIVEATLLAGGGFINDRSLLKCTVTQLQEKLQEAIDLLKLLEEALNK